MALTAQQNIPKRPEEKSEWTMRKLFPFAAMASAMSKVFVNPFDVLLGFTILVIGLVELFGRHVSWGFYLIAIFMLSAALFERHADILKNKK